ncbi:MAG TPA: FAD-linked oxidase C-terminal domain-containing protein [Chloroflexia bacterium]|nr:FAD-linked oxidase C-terminal domain-containing protein [Chloroflexia bacterium]
MTTGEKLVETAASLVPIDRAKLVRDMIAILGEDGVLHRSYDLKLYEYDGSVDKHLPEVVVFPRSAEHVAAIVRYCNREKLYYTARGAGTGLSGGSIPIRGGVLVAFTRMNHILEIDAENLRAVVEPGVVNLHLSQALAPYGLYYVPDPSSQKACTIGGNVGENSGGPHTLVYGVTTNHVTGLEVVTPDGEIRHFGGKALDGPGYDLTGLFVGSEGTIGMVTKITVRLTPLPPGVKTFLAIFDDVEKCSNAVSGIIRSGVIPAALEMMDNLMIGAVEASSHAGYPLDAAAVLLVECEGLPAALEQQATSIEDICRREGALEFRVARNAAEREALWKGRKGAFGAVGRISPDYYVVDGVVPRSKLPPVLAAINDISKKYGLSIANVFHAGDGNLHPLVMFDSNKPGDLQKALSAGEDIIRTCAEYGGSLSGEHGIGVEKRDMMCFIFNEDDLNVMRRVRDTFDREGLCNPAKVIPTPGRCGETRIPTARKAQEIYERDGMQTW